MEYLDLYDKNKNKIGKKILRGSKIPENTYIMLSLIFIENKNGEYLFQMTSKEKGSIWATTGGHVKSGDNSFVTIKKELKEELGLTLNPRKIKHIYTIVKNNRILEIYYLKEDIDISKLVYQKEEVEYAIWISKKELKKFIDEDRVRKSNVNIMKKIEFIKG